MADGPAIMEGASLMIRALIFDFDGLILETEGPIFQSWQEFYQRYGQVLSIDTWGKIIGTANTGYDPFTELELLVGKKLARSPLEKARLEREMELVMAQPVLPGVHKCLADARQLGLKLAVASSSPRSWVHGHLTRLDLIEYFDCLRTSDDVRNTKPDPELYLSAIECLGISAPEALALEDSPHGITAAKAAGLYCVAVPNDLTRRLGTDHADLTLSSMQDLDLEELIKRINHH